MDVESLLATIPTPTEGEMERRGALARRYTLVLFRRGPASREVPGYERIHLEHLQHLTKLQILGKLVLNGPTLGESEISGVSIYAIDPEEARALAEADPKVKSGHLTVEVIPWVAVPSDTA